MSKKQIMLFFSIIAFFIVHAMYTSWDFVVYSLNAKYFAGISSYFELSRPPLMSFAIFLLGANKLSEYLFIMAGAILYYFSCKKFSNVVKIKNDIFYFLMLNPFVLLWGLQEGSELISLSLIMLGISYILEKRSSGLWLGLSVMTRYTNLTNIVLILFTKHKKWSEKFWYWIKNSTYFFIAILPWLIYNKINTGNYLTSMADSFANVIKFRGYLTPDHNWHYIFFAINLLLPFLIYGIYTKIKQKKFTRVDAILISFTTLTIYNYITTPITVQRYLFHLTLPIAYYSYFALRNYKIKTWAIITYFVIFITVIGSQHIEGDRVRSDAIYQSINELNISHCAIMSDYWVYLPYFYNKDSKPPARVDFIDHYLKQGYVLIYEDDKIEHENKVSMRGLTIIYNKTSCLDESVPNYYRSYLTELQEVIKLKRNHTYNIDACNIFFENKNTTKKICETINQI